MPVYEIPLVPGVPTVRTMVIANQHMRLRFAFAAVGGFEDGDDAEEGGWFLDMSATDGTPILCGVPLVTGEDIFAQFPDLGLPVTWVITDGEPDAVPTWDNLGTLAHIYFVGDS